MVPQSQPQLISIHSLALQVHYAFRHSGLNSLVHYTPDEEITKAISRAVQCMSQAGVETKQVGTITFNRVYIYKQQKK